MIRFLSIRKYIFLIMYKIHYGRCHSEVYSELQFARLVNGSEILSG